ncbi:MAG: alpha/beta fold hydrolase [Flavobacteriales bacterium]|jgi:pimeloyl-ACP methyl ester carboxylesterase|nr:alpha/beta fold hydrolase [Flavobacteriales bacterium]
MSKPGTLLFIHGFPLDHTLWRHQVRAFSGTHRVLAPDLRGFGEDKRAVPEEMTMERYAADLKELLDEQGVERATLVGLSMGGYIAMAFAAKWPDMVRGLVLANTRAGGDDEDAVKARREMARNAVDKGMAVIARGMVPNLLSDRTRQRTPRLAAEVEAMIARQSPQATAAAAKGMARRPDRTAWLRTLRLPVLVITGEQDKLMPLPTSQAMADALPRAALVVLSGAGHLSNLEQPEAFNAQVEAFLGRL